MNLKIKILISLFFSITLLKAQSPDLINYQAVARDISGNPLVSTPVNVTYDIRQSSSTGPVVYSETHSLTTNQFGLFTAEIGGGTPVSGTFAGINWSTGLYYLQVTINGDIMPATQLLSVPYALHANTATSGTPGANGHANLADSVSEPAGPNCANGGYLIHMGADDNDDGTLQALERDISYYICNGLDGSANNNDTSATNELQTISISNDTIFLSNGGFVKLPPALGDNWGSQVVITAGSNISGDGTSGNPLTVTDSVIDADADPNNERITTFSVNGTNDSLIIVESGVGHAMPLSDLSDGDWTKGIGNDIYNTIDSVGIGTNNPKSPLQIHDNMHWFPISFPGPEQYGVRSYNAYFDGTSIRNTQAGVSSISFMGHENGNASFGLHLFPSQPANSDLLAVNPDLKIILKQKGFGVNVDNPDAGIDVEPLDSAGIILRMANTGNTSHLFFEDTQVSQVGLRSPNVLASNYVLTLPTNLPTSSGSSLVSDLAGNLSWGSPSVNSIIHDLDGNTSVDVEQTTNEDIIHFNIAGTEYFRMDGGHLYVLNNGTSTFYGDNAGALSTGVANTAIGFHTLQSLTTGQHNTGIGANSMITLTTGLHNTAVGSQSLQNSSGSENVALGWRTLMSVSSNENTAIGTAALQQTTSGGFNTSLGYHAGFSNTTGSQNTAIGRNALTTNISGSMNTALGYNADVTSPSLTNATAIGANTVASQSNSMILGNGADVGIGTSSPSTRLVVAGGNMILRDQTDVVDAVELASGTGAGASGSIGIRNSGVNTVFLSGTGSSWFNAGRLGVGTNSPLERFHVFEQTNLDVLFESATGLADFTIDAAVNRADIIFKRSGATEGSIGYNLTNDYLFLNDGVESLVSRNGDIGIGTNTPSANLDLVGTFQYVDGNQAPGFVLTSNASGDATWQSPVKQISFSANTSNTTIPNGTPTNLVFTNIDYNLGNAYNNGTGIFTAPDAGVYHFDAIVTFDPTGTYNMQMQIRINGGTYRTAHVVTNPSGNMAQIQISSDAFLNSGDNVTINLYQTSGAALTPVSVATAARVNFNGHFVH